MTKVPEFIEWEFGKIYKAETRENAVRAAKMARNAGFKTEFKLTGDPEMPYGFILVDPFEGMRTEDNLGCLSRGY